MENNSQESNQNTNYQPQNQGQAYPQPQNAPPQNQEPKDPQLQCQKSLLYQQAEDLEQINKQEQLSAYSQQPLQPMQQSLEQIQPLQPMQPPQQQMEQSLEQIQPLQPMQPPQQINISKSLLNQKFFHRHQIHFRQYQNIKILLQISNLLIFESMLHVCNVMPIS